jgi:hypothetical protein
MPSFNSGIPTRAAANTKAAVLLRRYIHELGLPMRRFAKEAGIAESTLRFFLSAGNGPNANGRRHGRGPYLKTLAPLLTLRGLPDEVREALIEAIYYEDLVVARIFGSVRGRRPEAAQTAQTSQ